VTVADTSRRATRLERLFEGRANERRKTATALARATLRALHSRGITARVVGSLAQGKFRAESDIDYLIEDRAGVPEGDVVGIIEVSMRGFPFDAVFAERADPRLLKMMREEAERGQRTAERA
jgi:predicted nucleotidyltransferase